MKVLADPPGIADDGIKGVVQWVFIGLLSLVAIASLAFVVGMIVRGIFSKAFLGFVIGFAIVGGLCGGFLWAFGGGFFWIFGGLAALAGGIVGADQFGRR